MRILLLALFISIMVLLMSASMFFYYTTPLSESTYLTSGKITENTGCFDINTSAITFGSITIGGSSTRSIWINNSYPFAIKVKPVVKGSISEKVKYDSIIIKPYEASSFKLTFFANNSSSLGYYNGEISILLLRA